MKLLAFELCTLHLFSKSQQSYTTDIFETQVKIDATDLKNSFIALDGSYTDSKTWRISYSENLGGTITQKELVIHGLLESGKDASTTNQGCCGMGCFSNGKKNSRDEEQGCIQPLMLSPTVLIKILESKGEKHKLVSTLVSLTYKWIEDTPQLYMELPTKEDNTFQSRKTSFTFKNDMLGPLTADIQLDKGLSKEALEISYQEHLYFDFKRLTTGIPTKVYEQFKKRLQNIQGIQFFDKKNMVFECLDDEKMLSLPSITMGFKLGTNGHKYILTAKEYILRVSPKKAKIETLEEVCYLTLVPHDFDHEWIIGATIAKVMHLKMAIGYLGTVVGTFLEKKKMLELIRANTFSTIGFFTTYAMRPYSACNSGMVTLLVYLQVARSLLKLFIANEPYVL